MSHPSKRRGYDVEIQALEALVGIFPGLRRTGSMGYQLGAADLERVGHSYRGEPFRLVVTKDLRRPLLVSLPVEDLEELMRHGAGWKPVVVQVKARKQTWVGKLWDELRQSTQSLHVKNSTA